MKIDENKPLPSKVEALYKAVNQLIDDGIDVHNMTVSEMTKTAGIGKGTAYEYFDSKEEIIVQALLYQSYRLVDDFAACIEQSKGFEDAMHIAARWIVKHCVTEQNFKHFVGTLLSAPGETIVLRQAFFKGECDYIGSQELVQKVIDIGKAEGYFRTDASDYEILSAMLSQFGMFFVYAKNPDGVPGMTLEAAEDIIVKNIRRLVGNL